MVLQNRPSWSTLDVLRNALEHLIKKGALEHSQCRADVDTLQYHFQKRKTPSEAFLLSPAVCLFSTLHSDDTPQVHAVAMTHLNRANSGTLAKKHYSAINYDLVCV